MAEFRVGGLKMLEVKLRKMTGKHQIIFPEYKAASLAVDHQAYRDPKWSNADYIKYRHDMIRREMEKDNYQYN